MKLASQLLDEYIERYPVYRDALFVAKNNTYGEKLPSLFVLTQHIIDTFIANGNKRIAIVLPNNECSILPMVLTKLFCNVQYEVDYAGSIFDEIQRGQKLRLLDSVVEFIELDKTANTVKFRVGNKTKGSEPLFITAPISGVFNQFEKCEGALSSWETFCNARKKACTLKGNGDALNEIKAKRTALRKTILVLTPKNSFNDFVELLSLKGNDFQDVVSYGEIDIGSEKWFNLKNRGKLDCLPALSVSARLDEIYALLKTSYKEKIFTVFSTADKFNEVISNIDTLKKCLKQNVPFVVFVPESSFEDYLLLADLEFELWHWKPSMMRSEVFLQENPSTKTQPLFGRLQAKVTQAALAEFDIKKCHGGSLKITLRAIRQLSAYAQDWDSFMRTLLHKIWAFQIKLTSLLCPINIVMNLFSHDLNDIKQIWQQKRAFFLGQEVVRIIDSVLDCFNTSINSGDLLDKGIMLSSIISEAETSSSIIILVPDRYEFLALTQSSLLSFSPEHKSIRIMKLSEFYSRQEQDIERIDKLVVTWFDKDEYIRIKQTYCYDKLIFLLYDFENKWREGFISRLDVCLPHEVMKKNASRIGLSEKDFLNTPSDAPLSSDTETDKEYKEIQDFNITKSIVRSIVRSSGVDANASDSVEVVPVLLSGDFIGYFYPTHEIIEVSGLLSGDNNRPLKKEACKLRKGDRILIRQSEKDIIKEKADEMLATDNKHELRETSSIWRDALSIYAEGKSVSSVCNGIRIYGGDCTEYQIRYWLAGETICPSEKSTILAILKAVKDILPIEDVDKITDLIFSAGREVRSYHQSAGMRLTRALRDKAREIKDIIRIGGLVSKGKVDGIGEILVYTVEDILDKEFISRGKLNKVEELF